MPTFYSSDWAGEQIAFEDTVKLAQENMAEMRN